MNFELIRSLTLAVLDYSPGWELLFEQIGVPCRALHNLNELSPEGVAVVIVNRHLWKEEIEALDAYVREGGAILDIGRFTPRLEPSRFRRSRVGSIFADAGSTLLAKPEILDLNCRALRRKGGELDGLVGIESRGAGTIASLGFDPGRLMQDRRAETKRFPGLSGRCPAERVASVSKGEIEKLLRRLLIRLYAERGLPFIRKRSFPDDASNVLCFRIDTDYGSREQIDALYDLAVRTGTAMTWFLHTEGHQGWLDRFRAFEGQELALHCRRHRTFPEFEENRINIANGVADLHGEGIRAEGFAAPNGIWNHGLAEAVDAHRFLYSSEFALACDTLPFRPILPIGKRVNKRFYNALQIPIHPVSVGNLLRVGMSDTEMIDYYRAVIDHKKFVGDPLAFYHHPTHERWNVVETLLREAQSGGVRNMTFVDYARWWGKREEADIEATFDGGTVTVRSRDRDPSVWLEIVSPDGRRGMIPEDGKVEIDHLALYETPQKADRLECPTAIREFSWKLKRRALHDWIIRTSR